MLWMFNELRCQPWLDGDAKRLCGKAHLRWTLMVEFHDVVVGQLGHSLSGRKACVKAKWQGVQYLGQWLSVLAAY